MEEFPESGEVIRRSTEKRLKETYTNLEFSQMECLRRESDPEAELIKIKGMEDLRAMSEIQSQLDKKNSEKLVHGGEKHTGIYSGVKHTEHMRNHREKPLKSYSQRHQGRKKILKMKRRLKFLLYKKK